MPERSILAWLAIGLVVGIAGKFVMPGREPGGITSSILIGIAGALIGGFVAQTMQWTPSGTWQNFAASVLGAVTVLAMYRLVRHRGR